MTMSARLAWAMMALLSAAVALVSYRYLLGVQPLPGVGDNQFVKPWLWLHAGGSATALLLGSMQFLPRLRGRQPRLHRWIGRTYVAGCLVGGLSGLLLAIGTMGGQVAATGFTALALAWVYSTLQGWRLARGRRFDEHRRWMVRSFALTLAAVTLRLYLPLSPLTGVDGATAYSAIAWLCWVPNLAAAELYIRLSSRRLPRRPIADSADIPLSAGRA